MNSWLVLLPSLLAITLAITTRRGYLSLTAGILAASLLLTGSLPAALGHSIDAVMATLGTPATLKGLLFILMIGALIHVLECSGAITWLTRTVVDRHRLVNSGRRAQLLTFLAGCSMCLEGVCSMMVVGLIGRPLFDRYQLSRAKLALIANCTGAPLAWLFPFGGAGIFLLTLLTQLAEQRLLTDTPLSYLLAALPYQLYTLLVLACVPLLALLRHDFHDGETRQGGVTVPHKAAVTPGADIPTGVLLLPLILLPGAVVPLTLVTGIHNIGDTLCYSSAIALAGTGLGYRLAGVKTGQYLRWVVSGCRRLLPAILILVLAFSLSNQMGQLGTGSFLAALVTGQLPGWLLPCATFVMAMSVAFSTGSSGATVSIFLPIAVAMAVELGVPAPMIIGAVVSGAVFGDQSSPISDSVIVAASAAHCDRSVHFRSQLPITLSLAGVSALGYLLLGASL